MSSNFLEDLANVKWSDDQSFSPFGAVSETAVSHVSETQASKIPPAPSKSAPLPPPQPMPSKKSDFDFDDRDDKCFEHEKMTKSAKTKYEKMNSMKAKLKQVCQS